MLDGYKHYSYETPWWIREGLAHFVEREINPKFNSFDSTEGAVAEMTKESDWSAEVKRMIQSGKAPRMAEMANLKTPAEFKLPHHFACWSMTAFLIEKHPEAWACLN